MPVMDMKNTGMGIKGAAVLTHYRGATDRRECITGGCVCGPHNDGLVCSRQANHPHMAGVRHWPRHPHCRWGPNLSTYQQNIICWRSFWGPEMARDAEFLVSRLGRASSGPHLVRKPVCTISFAVWGCMAVREPCEEMMFHNSFAQPKWCGRCPEPA